MASPCQLLVDGISQPQMHALALEVEAEARRIETKYSRYTHTSVLAELHASAGRWVELDSETSLLFAFAKQLYELSDGLFDVSSGVLRAHWKFEAGQCLGVPDQQEVKRTLKQVGFERIEFKPATPSTVVRIKIPQGMQLDFGGIGKEYAVDRCFELVAQRTSRPFLINFGGDLRVSGPKQNSLGWQVGLECADAVGSAGDAVGSHARQGAFLLRSGALATSGDARRSFVVNGIRYAHILNPKTGWPVENAPRSVTVWAPSCIEAGMLSTLCMLKGSEAAAFASSESLTAWVQH